MKGLCTTLGVAAFAAWAAGSAMADSGALEDRVARVEQQLASQSAPSAREIQSSVDAYLASAKADATLVGGPGSAGYDGGFWIRGGSFLLKINLTLQTRYEYFDWDDREVEPSPGGDLSGFSLPRVTLKLSGDATCDVHYYAELEFGHPGTFADNENNFSSFGAEVWTVGHIGTTPAGIGPVPIPEQNFQVDYGIAREAWIEYETSPALVFRMGLIKTAATRQLMTPPEMQQFVDISLASAFIGQSMPGYTDRNRDYGFMLHGVLGCDGGFSYMLTVSNGDGPVHHNVVDGATDDPLAYSARINWDLKGHMGYEEGALRQHSCEFVASIGAWAHYYVDHIVENPLVKFADRLTYGVDAAAGWGGFSFTGAYSAFDWSNSDIGADVSGWSALLQVGFLFPDTAWEVAIRASMYSGDFDGFDPGATEYGIAVNYYIDGHADKLTVDASFITSDDDGNFMADAYAGYNVTFDSDGMLIRFQWQLAL